ncbi:MAG: CTP synthetase, partial [Thermoplasmata archaeon]
EQKNIVDLGGTMRLGSQKVILKEGSKAFSIYGEKVIYERHRHRYEVNESYIEEIESKGMKFTGFDETGRKMEIFELENHPFYMASQFHPEFKSRPLKPSKLHLAFVKAAYEYKKSHK